jgi:hypothetical protein
MSVNLVLGTKSSSAFAKSDLFEQLFSKFEEAGYQPPVEASRSITALPGSNAHWRDWLASNAAFTTRSTFGEHHIRAWEWFDALEPDKRPPALIECWPRGHGKSTTVELAMARMAVRATRQFCLYVSCSQDAANRHVQAIGGMMERVGVQRAVNKYGHSRGWSANMLRTSNGFNVLAFGLDAGARGVKLDDVRPDMIILDDVDELGDSVDAVIKKIETITQTILPAGSTDAAVAFFQNLIHANSVMSQVQSGQTDMLRNRMQSPVIVAVNDFKYEEYEADGGLTAYRVTGGVPTWEGKNIEICQQEVDTYGLISFLRECQQDVGVGGLMFPQFKETKDGADWHVCAPFDIPPHWDVWASHDYGTGAACASYIYTADERGDVYVVGEHYREGLESSAQALAFGNLCKRLGVGAPIDPKNDHGIWKTRVKLLAFDHANTFPPQNPQQRLGEYPVEVWWRMGFPAVMAVKDRIAGWGNCREWLAATRTVEGVMRPRLRFFRGATPNLLMQIAKAPCNPKSLEDLDPGFRNDHALDSWRYGLMTRPLASKKLKAPEDRYRDYLLGQPTKTTYE